MPELEHPQSVSDLLKNKSLETAGSLSSQVFSILKELIISLQLRPGQMISEKEVAEALKASKTPVREAMIRLQGIGLVRVVPKSGTYVTPIQVNRYIEACFARQQLEIGAVRRAAVQQNWNANLQMESLIQKQVQALKAGEDEVFFQLDEALHKSFFEAAGVPGVSSLIRDSQAEVNRMRYLKRLHNIRREDAIIEEHQAIVAAIRNGSPDDAEAAMIRHIGSLDQEVEQLASHAGLLEFIEGLNSGRFKHRA
uniref:GntR family transcriptional regulator n=1 Tax=uncultured Thiotrichaceae bacterium TaxID=298394 RepID=A0A6S6S955_9GAMM|nr:MAG: GntR family transcriptional regulator [uncultured Thiotrichaceae bacterium]